MKHGAHSVWLAGLLLSVLLAVLVTLTAAMNHGLFTYSIDDPYIHLDLADTFWQTGVYGVNPGDGPSSPSSSPLWPLLLAPFSSFSWQYLIPLFINITCCLLMLPVLQQILLRIAGRWQISLSKLQQTLILFASILALNQIALVFSGLEHNLQVLTALLVVLATMRMAEEGRVPQWLWLILIIAPLVRYENLSLSLVTFCLFTFWLARGHTVLTGLLLAATLGSFTLYLLSLGLDPLPNSIVVRKYLSSNLLASVSFEIRQGLGTSLAILMFMPVMGAVTIWLLRQARQWREYDYRILLAVLMVMVLHLVAGKFGPPGFNRYEIYAIAYAWPLLLYSGRGLLAALAYDKLTRSAVAFVLLGGVVINPLMVYENTVRSAHAIYLQQAQMHDFIVNVWKGPVAVNDIGLVGYRNPYYVLDMWGLASTEARNIHWYGRPDEFAALAARHHVDLAMLYPGWFSRGELSHWIPVGMLRRTSGLAAHGAADVTIYATRPEAVVGVRQNLQRWSLRLPEGAEMRFFEEGTAQP